VLPRQVLYPLSHATCSFCSGYFGDRVLLLAWLAWNHGLSLLSILG
jgi:hypothetical protein